MTPTQIEKIFRDEASGALATLIRLVGDFDLAEDALQDAFAVALEHWYAGELPANPRAWLVNVGRNKAIDRIRRTRSGSSATAPNWSELISGESTCPQSIRLL